MSIFVRTYSVRILVCTMYVSVFVSVCMCLCWLLVDVLNARTWIDRYIYISIEIGARTYITSDRSHKYLWFSYHSMCMCLCIHYPYSRVLGVGVRLCAALIIFLRLFLTKSTKVKTEYRYQVNKSMDKFEDYTKTCVSKYAAGLLLLWLYWTKLKWPASKRGSSSTS